MKYSNKNLTSQTIASNSTYPYFDFTFLKSLRANGATKYTPNKELRNHETELNVYGFWIHDCSNAKLSPSEIKPDFKLI